MNGFRTFVMIYFFSCFEWVLVLFYWTGYMVAFFSQCLGWRLHNSFAFGPLHDFAGLMFKHPSGRFISLIRSDIISLRGQIVEAICSCILGVGSLECTDMALVSTGLVSVEAISLGLWFCFSTDWFSSCISCSHCLGSFSSQCFNFGKLYCFFKQLYNLYTTFFY